MNEQKVEPGARVRGTLYLELSGRLCMDPTEVMETYTGRLIWTGGGRDYVVGKTRWWVIRVNEMINRQMDPFMAVDGEDADTAEFGELFLEDDWEWPEPVRRVCPEALFGDVAILDRLVVYAPFRGRDVGLHCIEMTMRITGGMGLFALKPFPLQHCPCYSGRGDLAHGKSSLAADRNKLFTYYARAGFKKVRGSKFMVLDPRVEMPDIKWADGEGDIVFDWSEAMEQHRLKEDGEREGNEVW